MPPTALPAFNDNYIWVLHGASGATVVDPGCYDTVAEYLKGSGERLHCVLVTHHHPDHIGGLARLRQDWPQLQVYGPVDARIGEITQHVADGDCIQIDSDLALQVLATPGHTRSHIGYLADGWLYCGDTLISLGCGRLFEGSAAQMLASLDRLAQLPGSTQICCAHEYTLANARFAQAVDPDNQALLLRTAQAQEQRRRHLPTLPTTLASEITCNPFLRSGHPAIMASAGAWAGRPMRDRGDSFATLRSWKDVY